MTYLQNRVKSFMLKAGQKVPAAIEIPSKEQRMLRVKLLLEEVLEYANAAGIKVAIKDDYELSNIEVFVENFTFIEGGKPNLVDMIDGLCDTIYVAVGGQLETGINPETFDAEVCDSNDSKFIDGYRNDDGKWVKGNSYRPVNLKPILDKQIAAKNKILRDDEAQLKLNLQ